MSNPYFQLFSAPGAAGFVLAGLLARLALPMMGIGMVTMVSLLRGSYALAGAVSATFVLTYALLAPQTSRLVDRYGQARVLPLASGVCVLGMLVLLATTWWDGPNAMLFVGALLAGFLPSLAAMLRARWIGLYRGQPQLQTAYALEAVLDEVSFVAGPPVSVALAVGWFPQAGLLAAALLLVLGVSALVVQRGTEPPLQLPDASDAARPRTSLIAQPQVLLLAWILFAMGVIVGAIDIVSVAFAGRSGQPTAAGWILAAYAVGSGTAGLLFGALQLSTPRHKLLLVGTMATAATTVPLLLADSVLVLGVAVLFAGLSFAPTMIVAMSMLERTVPAARLTEAMTWLLSGLNVGAATGAASSGWLVDRLGVQAGFLVAFAAGLLALAMAVLGYRRGLRQG